MKRAVGLLAIAALCLLAGAAGPAAAQMPDARQMSGMPLPVTDLPAGTVSVRVVRGVVSNVVPDHPVELLVDGETLTARTDASGRATFSGLRPGARVRARTTVGQETLESQDFPVPATGGIRTMLVASDADAQERQADANEAAAPPAQPGEVTIGPQSRIIVELTEEAAEIYYLLDIRNPASTPVQPKTPFVIDLPSGASASAILEGSSPQATAEGRRVTVSGPFRPGATMVQAAFRLPYDGGRVEFSQAFPAKFEQPNIAVEKLPGVTLASAQFHDVREISGDGQTYLFAHARTAEAGSPLQVRVDGVPHHPEWPRYLALALAAVILGAGAWGVATARRREASPAAVRQLEARRDKLFAELTALEARARSGAIPEAQYARRRRELIAELERVYGDLDEGAAA